MRNGVRAIGLSLVAFTLCALRTPGQQETLPPGVTEGLIAQGAEVYKGPGACNACHGPDGKGIPNLGSNITDAEWTHSDGSFEGILKSIETGVASNESTVGVAMQPKGGAGISEEQMRAVAAYVWSLSRPSR